MGNKVTMDVIAGVNVDSTGLIVDTSKTGTGVRSSVGVNSDKVYFEVNITGNINIGLCDETNNLKSTGYHSSSSFVVQYGWNNYTTLYLSSTVYPYHNPVSLDLSKKNIIAFALDMEKYLLSIYLNGVLAIKSFELTGKLSNLGSKLYPFLFTGGSNNVSHTEWNFGATPFKYPIPEGYTSYNGNQSSKKYLLKDDGGYKRLIPETKTCVPNMTSNTTPSGEASCSSHYEGRDAYNAFSDNELLWECAQNSVKPWIQYKFETPKKITRYYIEGIDVEFNLNPSKCILEGSNDGISYTPLQEAAIISQHEKMRHYFNLDNTLLFSYYRITCLSGGTFGYCVFKKIEFYEDYTPEHFAVVSTEYPTADQFKEKGMSEIPNFNQLSSCSELIAYTTDGLSKSLVKFKPKDKTVLSSGAINFSGKELKKVSLIGTDNARVLFSKDRGQTWYNKTSNVISEIKDHDDGTVTSNGYYKDESAPWRAFDGNEIVVHLQTSGYWYGTDSVSRWIMYDLKESKPVSSVDIWCYIRGLSSESYNPYVSKISIHVSTDGVTWTEVIASKNHPFGVDNYINYDFNSTVNARFIKVIDNNKPGTVTLINEIRILSSTITPLSIANISTQGLTPTQLTAVTPEEWKLFMGDSRTLRFAYYLPDETANTDKLELTVDFIGE